MTRAAVQPAVKTAAPSAANARPAPGNRMFNFSAGPGMMPDEVLRQIQEEVWDCRKSGVGGQ